MRSSLTRLFHPQNDNRRQAVCRSRSRSGKLKVLSRSRGAPAAVDERTTARSPWLHEIAGLSVLTTFAALVLFNPSRSFATTKVVDTLPALQSAINEANAGDVITLKAGVYLTQQSLTVDRAGTASQPITIAAESVGGVELGGSHGFTVTGNASHVIITGFKFTHASGTTRIDEGSRYVRISRNTFLCSGDGAYLTISGDDAQIDYNEFGPKKTAGNMIAIAGIGSQVARRLWIHHNYFHDLANSGAEGAQMLRVGLMSAHAQSIGACLVEYNLFAGSRGVSELISNRSSGNTYRYNTLLDSPTAQLTLRQGNDCAVYGNYFRNTEGIRIYGDRHQIFSNYFEANHIGVAIGNGAPDPTDGSSNKNERPDDCVIAFNTFVDNTTAYAMSRRNPDGLGATNTVFSNNIIQGGGTVAKISGPYTGAMWSGNLIWMTTKIGDVPPDGFKLTDPQLVAGLDSIKRPQPGSPAIAAATEPFPAVAFDLDGEARPEKKSIGADEPGEQPPAARILTIADVGPFAGSPPIASTEIAASVPPSTSAAIADPGSETASDAPSPPEKKPAEASLAKGSP